MGQTTRRIFLLSIAATGTAMAATTAAAAGPAKLDPKDAQAVALGFVLDSSKADSKKYPQHAAGQKCGTCMLFQGKAGDASGPCPIFAGRLVPATGWCSSWVKKAA